MNDQPAQDINQNQNQSQDQSQNQNQNAADDTNSQSSVLDRLDDLLSDDALFPPEFPEVTPPPSDSFSDLNIDDSVMKPDLPLPPAPPVSPTSFASPPLPPTPPAQSAEPADEPSEKIEDQNIFTLLGVDDGTGEEQERFLDELQNTIWDDFLQNDVQLMISSEENERLKTIMSTTEKSKLEVQDEAIEFLGELIPDLEQIMLDRALTLKASLFRERIVSMRELHANQAEMLDKINHAEELMTQDLWASAAKLLNSID